MVINSSLRRNLSEAKERIDDDGPDGPATGIIPFERAAIDDREYLTFEVASMIDDALTGPAIHVWNLAEKIVTAVLREQR